MNQTITLPVILDLLHTYLLAKNRLGQLSTPPVDRDGWADACEEQYTIMKQAEAQLTAILKAYGKQI